MTEAPEQRKPRKTHGHKVCARCGEKSYHVGKKKCASCGYGQTSRRNDTSPRCKRKS